jgi:hypothetical protein
MKKFLFLLITLALATEKPLDFRPLRGPGNKNVRRKTNSLEAFPFVSFLVEHIKIISDLIL